MCIYIYIHIYVCNCMVMNAGNFKPRGGGRGGARGGGRGGGVQMRGGVSGRPPPPRGGGGVGGVVMGGMNPMAMMAQVCTFFFVFSW